MNLVYVLLPSAILLSVGFLIAFIWNVKSSQYDDLETPAHRILLDDNQERKNKI